MENTLESCWDILHATIHVHDGPVGLFLLVSVREHLQQKEIFCEEHTINDVTVAARAKQTAISTANVRHDCKADLSMVLLLQSKDHLAVHPHVRQIDHIPLVKHFEQVMLAARLQVKGILLDDDAPVGHAHVSERHRLRHTLFDALNVGQIASSQYCVWLTFDAVFLNLGKVQHFVHDEQGNLTFWIAMPLFATISPDRVILYIHVWVETNSSDDSRWRLIDDSF